MSINTHKRSQQAEVMDDFLLEGEELRKTLDEIATINRWLGGNSVTLNGLKKVMAEVSESQCITVVDIGCGNGDMCREVAAWGRKNKRAFTIRGVDANAFTIAHAQELSRDYPEISYEVIDVFSPAFTEESYDLVLATLTMHHFSDTEILYLMNLFNAKARIGVIINDLQRSKLAYQLFNLVCRVFRLKDMTRQDGLISILRGFKKHELQTFSRQVSFASVHLSWKWAFRYQWILKNI
ncbi:methyltransferase domain-containing protein [Siphonobacter sp. SORGH_AS_0500]|uniref:methyltransferase domain-containing protein n=1 Tax=Siphonobacter sp. SORGH_AS_0500 TaxID=1864824 RepID=UPI0028553D02|nr:methyltransferase domain-containing protein [Siphonobacter sp. SORGH_AS_0500]MDR6197193.1 2-polyprenyl-3-methyl-5-hydroxy-6-metoxy-1,4-benzoquinol methylase [Siphonobacter sp. SORGH_AS_0500]